MAGSMNLKKDLYTSIETSLMTRTENNKIKDNLLEIGDNKRFLCQKICSFKTELIEILNSYNPETSTQKELHTSYNKLRDYFIDLQEDAEVKTYLKKAFKNLKKVLKQEGTFRSREFRGVMGVHTYFNSIAEFYRVQMSIKGDVDDIDDEALKLRVALKDQLVYLHILEDFCKPAPKEFQDLIDAQIAEISSKLFSEDAFLGKYMKEILSKSQVKKSFKEEDFF